MPNVNIDVYADTHGAPKELKDVAGGLSDLDKKGGDAGISLKGLWKQFAAGQLAADALKKALGAAVDFMKDSIGAAAQQELAEKNLADALAITGRNVDELMPKFKDFANSVQNQTTYTDDAVLSTMALMAQLSDLDEEGLRRATEGAIGLASVFKIDLETAATTVAKAMSGSYDMLSRYGIKVGELKTEEEKRAKVLEELTTMYGRAKGETDTFSGSLAQLKNMWDEVEEAVGRAVTENKTVRELIDKIKGGIVDLIQSGKLEEWVESLSQSISSLIKIFEGLYTAIKTVVDLANKLPSVYSSARKFYQEQMSYVDKLAAEGKLKAEQFQESLKILKIPLEHLREEMEKGKDNWAAYTKKMKDLDDAMVANQGKVGEWINKAKEFLGIVDDAPPKIKKESDALHNETKKLKEKIEVVKTATLAHRDFIGVVENAPAVFEDEAYAFNELLPPARAFNDIVSLAPGYMDDMDYAVKTATENGKNYFDGLYNDIASGMGNTIEDFISEIARGMNFADGIFWEHGINFKKFFGQIFDDIKGAFFRMLGEMLADKVIGMFKDFFGKAASAAQEGAGNIVSNLLSGGGGAAAGAGGIWTGIGAFAGTLLGNLLTGGGGKQTDVTYWLKLIKDNAQNLENLAFNDTAQLSDIKNTLWAISDYLPWKLDEIINQTASVRGAIYDALSGAVSAQEGFEGIVRKRTLFLTHPQEYVRIAPANAAGAQAAKGETSVSSNIEAHVHLKPVVIKRDDGYLIDFVQEKIEYVKKQYDRGNWKIPITSVGGAA
jgi:uncharacterized coiled-coil DUF342 family protein